MAQTPASRLQTTPDVVDYTPVGATLAGTVVLLGTDLLGITDVDIAAGQKGAIALMGCFRVPKVSGAISQWDQVFWDSNGSPVTGTASSGAASSNSTLGAFLGWAIAAAGSSDSNVDVVKIPQSYVVGTG